MLIVVVRETIFFAPILLDFLFTYHKHINYLLRDDDNDKSEDEGEERVDFSVNTAARERQKMRDNFLAAEHGKLTD